MGAELIACYWTLGGNYQFGDHDESPFDFRDRVEAAARAGYAGFGLKHADLMLTLGRYGMAGVRSILADNGMRHLELEVLFDWFMTGEVRERSDAMRRDLLEAAEVLGAHHIKVAGDFSGRDWPIAQMCDAFAELAAQARDAGTVAALEPIPFSNIRDLATARAVIGDSAGRGGGLMLDIWHCTRGAMSLAEIASLPSHWIACAELDDGTRETVGNPFEDTLNRRRLCGDGEFDIRGFIAAVRGTGYDGPFGVELISEEQRARSLEDAATLSYRSTIAQLSTPNPAACTSGPPRGRKKTRGGPSFSCEE